MKGGLFGAILATALSWLKWHSIGWAVVHFLLGWIYVVWYLLVYVILR